MAQPLSQIYDSLNAAYNPQRDVYQNQLGQVDQQAQGAIQGANYQKDAAFQGITNQANSNGMFYSGAPIKEEQMYTGGTYAPAIANIQNAAQNQKFSLQGALAGVGVNQTNQANQIYGTQLGQDQQQNQFQQQLQMQQQQNQAMRDIYSRGSGGGVAQAAPSSNQVLASVFNGYNPGQQGRQANYTEQQLAPKIQAALNIPYNQALQQAYQYRKQVYGQ